MGSCWSLVIQSSQAPDFAAWRARISRREPLDRFEVYTPEHVNQLVAFQDYAGKPVRRWIDREPKFRHATVTNDGWSRRFQAPSGRSPKKITVQVLIF
jgi:hypothetical protein